MKIFLSLYLMIMLSTLILSCTSGQLSRQEENNMNLPENTAENEYSYWVNSYKVPCQGVAPMQCLQVQKGDSLKPDDWQLFYASIEGFSYEAGYLYHLLVREEKLPPEQVPADASSIKYSLVKVLSKETDLKLRLHDIWVLEKIEGKSIETAGMPDRPRMEIHLPEMRVMGFDGCNNFNGSISLLDDQKLKFGPIAATRKMCPRMDIPDQFHRMMNKVHSYQLDQLKLYFYDSLESEVLSFQKTD